VALKKRDKVKMDVDFRIVTYLNVVFV